MITINNATVDIDKEVLKEIEDLENFPLTECQQDIINFARKHVEDIIREEGIV